MPVDVQVDAYKSTSKEGDLTGPPSTTNLSLKPFFTVVEDAVTGEQHHPYVHYVFSDDDNDVIRNAALHALDPGRTTGDEDTSESSRASIKAGDERSIIIDIANDGKSIISTKSLSSRWQVINHSLSTAPTFGERSSVQDAGLMLRIVGTQYSTDDGLHGSRQLSSSKDQDTTEELLSSIDGLSRQYEQDVSSLQRLTSIRDRASPGA